MADAWGDSFASAWGGSWFVPRPQQSRPTIGKTIFTIQDYSTSSPSTFAKPKPTPAQVLVDQPASLFMFIALTDPGNTDSPNITLRFTKPDGSSTYVTSQQFIYVARNVRGSDYVVYNTDVDELDQFGWWTVEAFDGFVTRRSYFYIVRGP